MAVRRITVLLVFALASSLSAVATPPKPNSEATEALLEACAEGNEERILAAIAAGANVNARDKEKNTPLILAATQSLFGKERKIVEAFVKAKANVDAANKDGMTALMAASSAGRDGIVRLLLQNDANVDARDTDGWTALMYATSSGESSAAKELIEAKADVNATDKKGWTPLMMAFYNGHGAAAQQLLAGGATMPIKAPNGLNPILLAAYGRDLACVRQVLEAGQSVGGRDPEGWTALEVASNFGDGQIVMELLRAGADATPQDDEKKTALDRAKERDHSEVVALLGGPWDKPKPPGGTSISVPCPALSGKVEANFTVDGKTLVVTTTFPKPLTYYLGGGNVNRAKSATKFVYEGTFAPTYTLGADSVIDYSQYGTSVALQTKDADGNVRSKSVYANVLDVSVEKGGESADTSELGDDMPRAGNDRGVLVTRVPLSLLKLPAGKPVPVKAKIGTCEGSGRVKLP